MGDPDVAVDGIGHTFSVLGSQAARPSDRPRGWKPRKRACRRASAEDLLHLFGHRVLGAQHRSGHYDSRRLQRHGATAERAALSFVWSAAQRRTVPARGKYWPTPWE